MNDRLLLGIDAGNTKTIALLARADGSIVGTGRALGTADIHATSVDTAMAVITRAVDEAGIGATSPMAVAMSAAGADWPEDIELLRAHLGRRWSGALVVNDAIGALRAAVPTGPGVVIVCGTGAATGARGPEGRIWHSGFWQEAQGAHELGVQTLLAVRRADLGIDPPTTLTEQVLATLGEPDVEAVLHRWTRRDQTGQFDPALLAPLLLDAAETGDPAAVQVVEQHGAALAATAMAGARRVGIDGPYSLALAGGVFRHRGRRLADAVIAAVRTGETEVTVVRPALEPAVGALLLAFDAAHIGVDARVEARLHATMPPPELFDTHLSVPAAKTG